MSNDISEITKIISLGLLEFVALTNTADFFFTKIHLSVYGYKPSEYELFRQIKQENSFGAQSLFYLTMPGRNIAYYLENKKK